MNKKGLILIVFLIFVVLHQDFWNWDNSNLVFGFMPVGLFYHACYSLAAAAFWASDESCLAHRTRRMG